MGLKYVILEDKIVVWNVRYRDALATLVVFPEESPLPPPPPPPGDDDVGMTGDEDTTVVLNWGTTGGDEVTWGIVPVNRGSVTVTGGNDVLVATSGKDMMKEGNQER